MKNKWADAQLQNISDSKIEEHSTWLNMFNSNLSTTALLLIALFQDGIKDSKIAQIIICGFGIMSSFTYYYIQRRAEVNMQANEKLIDHIEKKLDYYKSERMMYYFKGENIDEEIEPESGIVDKQNNNHKKRSARPFIQIISIVQGIGWGLGFLFFIIKELLVC